MRDLYNNINDFWCFQNSTVSFGTAHVSTGEVFIQGYNALTFLVNVGSNGSNALTSANHWHIRMQEAAASGVSAGTFADVTNGYYVLGGTGSAALTSGVVGAIDDETGDDHTWTFGYIGPQPYVKLVLEPIASAPDLPLSITALRGEPNRAPVA